MYFTTDSILFQAVDRSDSPTPFMDGCIGDKYTATIIFHFQKGCTNGQSGFTPCPLSIIYEPSLALGIITAQGIGEAAPTENFITDGFQIGETIKLPQSILNTGTFTITGVTATTLTVTGTMVNEVVTSNIWVTNLITSFDYLYNLLPNGSSSSFQSLTDNSQQKYIINSSTGNFIIGTPSKGWVTDTLTGNVSECTIEAGGITSDFQQPFTIVHTFFVTPLALANQLINFQQEFAPAYYPLTYFYGINGYYTTPPILNASITGNVVGTTCWANQNNAGTSPEFYVSAIKYIDNTTNQPLNTVDFTKTVLTTITVKSVSGLFSAGIKFILSNIYIPLSVAQYQNTSTTLRQNFMNDRVINTPIGGSVNGEFYGGNYSIFNDMSITYVDAATCIITVKIQYSSYLQNLLKSRATNNYSLLVTVET